MNAHAPVAELVTESLDHDGSVVGQHAGRLALLGEVGDQVSRREFVEPRCGKSLCLFWFVGSGQLPQVGAERPSQLDRPADGVAVPEGKPTGEAGSRRDQDPIVRDVLDPPAGRTEDDHVADPRFVHHLLIELADTRLLLPREEHAEQAAVGDGPS